ncbi:pentatricopeptide repeat-containing protein At1g62910-like [Impatiens glandulifera]|uniref:pentatricopeptide repeat-containing protein At1g62910-like n=1 Tax=Impatiens glandulifera TaxID=253017 RepID=UPI001FB156B7|nr:pentatricopeptide repeat-containing protein At1g62910-like [Impatiens glandulifera]XP_047306835.1 pentatricopeptide repeat-containing protein At1g62910-like [Impatiens glandulifera]
MTPLLMVVRELVLVERQQRRNWRWNTDTKVLRWVGSRCSMGLSWVIARAYASSSVSMASEVQISLEIGQDPSNSSEFESKLKFLRSKLDPDRVTRVLDATRDVDSSLKLFKWASLQKSFQHNCSSYCSLIAKLGMKGNVTEMEGFCNEMVKAGYPGVEEALLGLITLFLDHGKLSEALRVLASLISGRFKPSIGVFNDLLAALVEGKKDFSYVVFVYKEMVKASVVPDINTLNYLLEALFMADRVDVALDQYRRMSNKGCSPNSKTFEVLIEGLLDRDRIDDILVVLDEMSEIGDQPSLSFYTSLIPAFCNFNKPDLGIRLFEMMRTSEHEPDSQLYGVLIKCLCKNLRVHDGISLFEEMSRNSLAPSDDMLVDIVNGLCKLGKYQEATQFIETNHVVTSSPYNALVQNYCKTANFSEANKLFGDMLERNIVDLVSWNILIRWLCENTRFDKALQFLSKMIVLSFVPDLSIYSSLIFGKCKLTDSIGALELFHAVCVKGWVLDSNCYAELVDCLCYTEMIQEAVEIFKYMSNTRCNLQSSSFDKLIAKLCESGSVLTAVRILITAYDSRTFCSNRAYNYIILGLLKSKKANDVFILMSRMLILGCSFDEEIYCVLVKSTIELHRAKDSALLFSSMVREGFLPDYDILTKVLLFLGKHSILTMILPTINKLVSFEGILSPAMYNIMINGLWREGSKSDASFLLDVMLEKGWVPDAATHSLLMGSVARMEDGVDRTRIDEDGNEQDSISSILAEALGDAS